MLKEAPPIFNLPSDRQDFFHCLEEISWRSYKGDGI
jgi:hypothetical protein